MQQHDNGKTKEKKISLTLEEPNERREMSVTHTTKGI
jgi:hypothetical protein